MKLGDRYWERPFLVVSNRDGDERPVRERILYGFHTEQDALDHCGMANAKATRLGLVVRYTVVHQPAKGGGYTDERFPEFASARREDGVCWVCNAQPGEGHRIRDHDNLDAALEATW